MIKFLKSVKKGIVNNMKYHKMSLLQALAEEYRMMFHIMGIKLYIKYLAGTAVEGVDF